MSRPRIAALLLLCLALAPGCAPAPSQPAAAPAAAPTSPPTVAPPTVAPTATLTPIFATGSTVAGVDVGGMTLNEAEARLREALVADGSITLEAGDASYELELAAVGATPAIDTLLAAAAEAIDSPAPARVPPQFELDEAALRAELGAFAEQLATPAELQVITGTDVLSRSFAYTPGRALDLDGAAELVAERIAAGSTGAVELELVEDPEPPRVGLDRLIEEVETLAAEWDGVVGFHLYDLESGESVGYNDRTVFAGASTIKTAIMLYAYANLERFDELELTWLEEMIVESDNLAANGLLAAGAGGQGTEYAFEGADAMSVMLEEQLGLRHTYLFVPYETADYIKLYKPKFRCGPAGPVGEKPYTEMGPCLRAEPASMARLYALIDECANGEGLLLDEFAKLDPERCQEMLDRLAENGDTSRMVAGVPEKVRVEHKSGWIEDMQADAGIIRSPGGDYVLAVYVYRPLLKDMYLWKDEVMAPAVAAFSHLAYTAFNPLPLDEAGEPVEE
jgi:beta-lactamase class A